MASNSIRLSRVPTLTRPMIHPPKSNALPHLTPTGDVHQITISRKPTTARSATALGRVLFSAAGTTHAIRHNLFKKGDVLAVARLAGIMMAKRTSEVVPLAHGLMLTGCRVECDVFEGEEGAEVGEFGGVEIKVTAETVGKTGVEMEALSGVCGAALSVIDMVKKVDRGARIDGVRVVGKVGGQSGDWEEVEGALVKLEKKEEELEGETTE